MRNPSTNNAQKEEENNPDVVDAFGSLSLISGREKYYGQIANSWVSIFVNTVYNILTNPAHRTVLSPG